MERRIVDDVKQTTPAVLAPRTAMTIPLCEGALLIQSPQKSVMRPVTGGHTNFRMVVIFPRSTRETEWYALPLP